VAKVRERLAVSEQTMHGFHMERFSHNKLNEIEGKEQYHVEISNSFTTLENLDDEVDFIRAWETVRENVRFEVLTAVTVKNAIFWDVAPCRFCVNQRIGEDLHRATSQKTAFILLEKISKFQPKVV
jgi:hypothetical protein